jgi:hypothetical protein
MKVFLMRGGEHLPLMELKNVKKTYIIAIIEKIGGK